MKDILIIATYFPPEGGVGTVRVTKYVKYLKEFNWNPTVVTISEDNIRNYDDTLLKDIAEDTEIIRLKLDIDKNKKIGDRFYKALRKNIDNIMKEKKYSAVFITGGPFEPLKIAPYIYKKYKVPYIIDLRDPWKLQKLNTATRLTALKSIIKKVLIGFSERRVFKNSYAICTVNDTMTKQYVREYKKLAKKFYTIPNGYDKSDYCQLKPIQNKEFTIIYSGKFEVSAGYRNPTNLFKAIKIVNDKGYNVNFMHIGEEEKKVIETAKREKIEKYCRFVGRKTYKETLQYCKGADLLVVIGGEQKNEQTGKIFDYIGCRRPILVLSNGDTEIDNVCDKVPYAYSFRKNDIEGIANNIVKTYNSKGKDVDNKEIEEYDRKNLTAKLVDILEKIK